MASMHARNAGLISAALLAGMTLGACQPAGTASSAPPQTPATTAALPSEQPPSLLEMEAMAFRGALGLQADLAYVRVVAADPSAVTEPFGVPFLPAEIKQLQHRAVGRDAVTEAIVQESERAAADYCGVYIDNEHGGVVRSMWRANLHTHAINIAVDTGSFEYLAFEGCTYSWNELLALKERLAGDPALKAWLATIPAQWVAIGPDTIENRVSMDISSAAPDAAERVRQHIVETFAVPAGMILVRSDGTGQVLRPWGTVRILVVRSNGKSIGPNDMGFLWDPVNPPNGACGVMDMGFGPSWDDRPTELPCQEGTWRIRVMLGGVEYGAGTATVAADKTVDLTIKLTADPPAAS